MSKLSTFDDILRPYVGVMTEVKRRLGILQWALTSPELAVEEQYRIELGALELRMTIELIAVGLLYAHGDIEATRTGQIIGNYRPGDVFEKLEMLHSDFYPHPVDIHRRDDGIFFEPLAQRFPNARELHKMWGMAGDQLHINGLRGYENRDRRPVDIAYLDQALKSLDALLGIHSIHPVSSKTAYVIQLNTPPEGRVSAYVIKPRAAEDKGSGPERSS